MSREVCEHDVRLGWFCWRCEEESWEDTGEEPPEEEDCMMMEEYPMPEVTEDNKYMTMMREEGRVPEAEDYLRTENAKDRQVGGSHYKDLPIQPIEFIMQNELGWCEGNIVKYITRYNNKGGVEDIDKVIHYATILKESLSSS